MGADVEVVYASPQSMRRPDFDAGDGLCAMCAAPAALRIMHRCGHRGADACAACWAGHLTRCRKLIDQFLVSGREPLGTCRYCCDPTDLDQTVGLDHIYAEPIIKEDSVSGNARIQYLDFDR